jgi:hypothetical protein
VLLIYSPSSPIMAASVLAIVPISLTTSYPSGISSIEAAAPDNNAYINGYNKKCFFSMNAQRIGIDGSYIMDLNYRSPNLNYNVSGGSMCYMVYMCCAEYYNCSLSVPDCI